MALLRRDLDTPAMAANEGRPPAPVRGSVENALPGALPADLVDLVEDPFPALDVEIKSWRNPENLEDQAELARDIAALANFGGGYIIFGFDEQSLVPAEPESFSTHVTAERLAVIEEVWLDPPIRCELAMVRSAERRVHPVIRVPSHGKTPVCIRRNGPVLGGKRIVTQGVYYTRKPGAIAHDTYIHGTGPQSEPIATAQEWAPLIRRCVRQERELLLGMIDATLEVGGQERSAREHLQSWHDAAHRAFLRVVSLSPVADSLARRHYAFSYAFDFARPEMLEHAQLPEFLRRSVHEVQETVRTGWSMFDPPYSRSVQPRFVTDPSYGDAETDFLEVAWLRRPWPDETADFWRVSPNGCAAIIRDYGEDRADVNQRLGMRSGTWLSPNSFAQEIAELVFHARAFAKFFRAPRHVVFRCEWWGLEGRSLFDPNETWVQRGSALTGHKVATAQIPAAKLVQGWPKLVAQLMAPLLRSIEPDLALGADWVRGQSPKWRTR